MIPYKPIPIFHILGIRIGAAPFFSILGFFVIGFLAYREFKRQKIKFERNEYLLFFLGLALSSLAGGRIWYYAEHWGGISTLAVFFNVFIPGLTSYGMLAGGFLFLLWSASKKNGKRHDNLGRITDPIVLYAPVYWAIYRVGCIFNGCCFGKRTNVPWAFHYIGTNINRHPSQAYEIIAAMATFGVLYFLIRRRKRFPGELSLWFVLLFSIGRFIVDFFRYYPPSAYFGFLSESQYICIGLAVIFTCLMIYNRTKNYTS